MFIVFNNYNDFIHSEYETKQEAIEMTQKLNAESKIPDEFAWQEEGKDEDPAPEYWHWH